MQGQVGAVNPLVGIGQYKGSVPGVLDAPVYFIDIAHHVDAVLAADCDSVVVGIGLHAEYSCERHLETVIVYSRHISGALAVGKSLSGLGRPAVIVVPVLVGLEAEGFSVFVTEVCGYGFAGGFGILRIHPYGVFDIPSHACARPYEVEIRFGRDCHAHTCEGQYG